VTLIGSLVNAWAARKSSAIFLGMRYANPKLPTPQALAAAATSSGVQRSPAIGA